VSGETILVDIITPVYTEGIVEIDPKYWNDHRPTRVTKGIKTDFSSLKIPAYKGSVVSEGLIELKDSKPLTSLLHVFFDPEIAKASNCLRQIPGKFNARAMVPLMLDLAFTAFPSLLNIEAKIPLGGLQFKRNKYPYYASKIPYLYVRDDNFRRLLAATSRASAEFPGQVYPFVPYDPRRPDALKYVEKSIGKKGFIGVKLYTRLGWMPYHNEKIYPGKLGNELDQRLDDFYTHCTKNEIPVINHTSPTGFPPEGFLVLPRFYKEGSGLVPEKPEDFVVLKHDYFHTRSLCRNIIWSEFRVAAQKAHYIQNTVSPYSWIPVLEKWPDLRLSFGHCGGELSVLHHFDELSEIVSSAEKYTQKKAMFMEYSMVSSGKKFRKYFIENLKLKIKEGIHLVSEDIIEMQEQIMEEIELRSSKRGPNNNRRSGGDPGLHDYLYPHLKSLESLIDEEYEWFINSRTCKQWLDNWEKQYEKSWFEIINDLMTKHSNVYADLSYISGKNTKLFEMILKKLVEFAEYNPGANTTVFVERIQLATDWWMTENEKMSASEMWRRFTNVIKPETDGLFEKWSSTNTLRFLNLGKRISDLESFYAKNTEEKNLPSWWPDLGYFYNV